MGGSSRHSDDAPPSEGLDLFRQELQLIVAVAQLAKASNAPAPDGAVCGEGETVVHSSRHSDDALASKGLDLLRQQLVLRVAMAQPLIASTAPAPDGTVGGDGEAVVCSSRHSDDAPASKGLDLLRQQLQLLVAVAQPAKGPIAPAPDSSIGGDGETVTIASRHSDDAPPSEGLDLLGQELALLVAVA